MKGNKRKFKEEATQTSDKKELMEQATQTSYEKKLKDTATQTSDFTQQTLEEVKSPVFGLNWAKQFASITG